NQDIHKTVELYCLTLHIVTGQQEQIPWNTLLTSATDMIKTAFNIHLNLIAKYEKRIFRLYGSAQNIVKFIKECTNSSLRQRYKPTDSQLLIHIVHYLYKWIF